MKILGTIILLRWVASLIGYLAMCVPINKNWNPTVEGRCGNQYIFTLVVRIPWVVTDFAILFAPIPVIRGLQLPRTEKIGICALFLTGALYDQNQSAIGNLAGVGNWSIIETNVTIICACLITIKPALQRAFPEKMVASARSGWSHILSKTSKSRLDQQESEATTDSAHEFRRIKEQPRHHPLLHETADRFGPLKLDQPDKVTLHDLERGKHSEPWQGF
ncbi:MAG: hypothetical protein LQ337_002743 [Flavoplaca oasis]|nr:MAG: hypothetical protein LQ337_002743 [Flavoplaca oasis]